MLTPHSLFTSVAVAALVAAPAPRPAPGPGLVATTTWLAQHLHDPNLVILQTGGREVYDQGHVPGARWISYDGLATGHDHGDGSLSMEMPAPAELTARLEKLGISDDSRIVVVYTEDWVEPSTRIMLALQAAGLGEQSSWLDGGLGAWKRAGLPVSQDIPRVPAGHIARARRQELVVDHDYVDALGRGRPGNHLVDARAPAFFNGPADQSRGMKGGHIPGAASLPYNTVLGDDGTLLPAPALEQLLRAAGIAPADTVTAYCHVGAQATVVLFAARVLGHPIRLYDGSMEDWSRRNLPTEGAKP